MRSKPSNITPILDIGKPRDPQIHLVSDPISAVAAESSCRRSISSCVLKVLPAP